MTSYVVDASVAAKWMLPSKEELFRPEAFRLLDDYGEGKIGLLVPDIFWAECGNILWKAVRQNQFSRSDADAAVLLLQGRAIPTVSSAKLLPDAMEIAFHYGRTVYDSLYVALASQARRQLITADERLANALAAYLPVKWLGSL
jgi:predicted nucleic acid-binding protein